MPSEIFNRTRKTVITQSAQECKSIFSKAQGLMFSKEKDLIFFFRKEEIVPLHMMFVFFPIDVLFLDKDKKVVEIKEDFRPWTFHTPRKKAKYVIELKAGTVSRTKTEVGDMISF